MNRVARGANLAIVLALCAVVMVLLWSKLNYLIWFDPSWWLQEMFRSAHGQVPYRDFFWPYPPLTVLVFGAAMRVLGAKFWVAQALINAFSLAVMMGVFFWTRRILPERLQVLCCALVLAVCATSQTYFSLFSLRTYGPALHVSAAGLLLLLMGVLRYLDQPLSDAPARIWMSAGAAVALTSKQEMVVAVPALFIVLVLLDRRPQAWLRNSALLGAQWFVPAVIVYALVGWWVGFGNLQLGIRGNGVAQIACPWWPTGFGLLAAAGALGFATLVAGAATLCDMGRWRTHLGRRYPLLLVLALAGGAVYIFYVGTLYPGTFFGPDSTGVKLKKLTPELLSTSSIFRPALWVMIGYWLYLVWRAARAPRTITKESLGVLLVFTVPVSLSPRSLFGTHLTPVPEVPAVCYPFAIVMAVYLLLRWLRIPYRLPDKLNLSVPARPAVVMTGLMLGYIAVRLIGGWDVLSSRPYTRLETPAGVVHVRNDGEESREILDYVMANTQPNDSILEVPDGGGIGFATGRPSYTFSTLWAQLPVPEELQARDLRKLQENPPRIVIGSSQENLGTFYGVLGTNGCTFPSIVWLPNRLSWRPGFVYPAIQWVKDNYRVDRKIGEWVVMRPK